MVIDGNTLVLVGLLISALIGVGNFYAGQQSRKDQRQQLESARADALAARLASEQSAEQSKINRTTIEGVQSASSALFEKVDGGFKDLTDAYRELAFNKGVIEGTATGKAQAEAAQATTSAAVAQSKTDTLSEAAAAKKVADALLPPTPPEPTPVTIVDQAAAVPVDVVVHVAPTEAAESTPPPPPVTTEKIPPSGGDIS